MEGSIPDLIIVGIGFPVGGHFLDTLKRRRWDYTPTVLTSGKEKKLKFQLVGQYSGGAPQLLAFMRQQLMLYRLFQRFVLGSPSLLWDDGFMFKFEADYAKTHTALPATMFVSMADNEGYAQATPDFNKFVQTLEQRRYTDLQWTAHIFADETHVSVLPATVSRGLRTIYRKK